MANANHATVGNSMLENKVFVLKVCAWLWIRFIFLLVKAPTELMSLIYLPTKTKKSSRARIPGVPLGDPGLTISCTDYQEEKPGIIFMLAAESLCFNHAGMLINLCHDQSNISGMHFSQWVLYIL